MKVKDDTRWELPLKRCQIMSDRVTLLVSKPENILCFWGQMGSNGATLRSSS